MNKNILLTLLAATGILSACSIGVDVSTPSVFGGYNFQYVLTNESDNGNCRGYSWYLYDPTYNNITCDKTSSTVSLYFGFQGSPNFYIQTPQSNPSNGITVVNAPTTEDPALAPFCANSPSEAGGNYSCTTTITAQNAESSVLYFTIIGSAGVTQFFKVTYQ